MAINLSKGEDRDFYENKTILIDNFRRIRTWGLDTNINKRSFFQDKGNESCVAAFIDSVSRNSLH